METHMKIVVGILLVLATVVGTLTSHAQQQPSASSTAKLETRIAELEKRVALLEAQLNAPTSRIPATTQPAIAGVAQADAKTAPLVLDDWDFSSGQGDFGQAHYNITLKLRNAGTKAIKLIDASVRFTDLLDENLYGIKVSPDLSIAPAKTYVEKGQYGINQFINGQARMRAMKKADIKATLVVRRVVFTDNTVMQIER